MRALFKKDGPPATSYIRYDPLGSFPHMLQIQIDARVRPTMESSVAQDNL